MRILYSHRIQSRDGQSVHVEQMVAALRQAGHDVLVVGPGFYQQAAFGAESRLVASIRARLPPAIGELAELAYNLPAYRRLRRAANTFRPDIIYERYNLYYLVGAWLAGRIGVPFYLEVNAPIADERTRFAGLRLRRLARRLEGRTWRAATRVVAVTGVLKSMIAAAGVAADRIEVVPNGIDPAAFADLPARPPAPDPLVLGFVGFVRDWHGLDAVIAALAEQTGAEQTGAEQTGTEHARTPGLDLVVVGDGPARAALERQAASLGIADRVRFTGLAPHEDVPRLVAGFDIALQPRAVAYASPLKIFDYMAAGRAIVAPDQPNIREILTNGETALLFDPASPDAVWLAVLRLAGDAALRARLGVAARAEIERRRYTWAGNAARLVEWAGHDRALHHAPSP
jgi:glycosyltransferase involved in cell wall biosynthesis